MRHMFIFTSFIFLMGLARTKKKLISCFIRFIAYAVSGSLEYTYKIFALLWNNTRTEHGTYMRRWEQKAKCAPVQKHSSYFQTLNISSIIWKASLLIYYWDFCAYSPNKHSAEKVAYLCIQPVASGCCSIPVTKRILFGRFELFK